MSVTESEILSLLDSLSPEEREVGLKMLEELETGEESQILSNIYEADYISPPASVDEFLDDHELLGEFGKDFFPYWRGKLRKLFAPTSQVQLVTVEGGIGGGKSTFAITALVYKMYLITMMKNPQSFFGLQKGTPIVFGFFSALVQLSMLDEYKTLIGIMQTSPYFRKISGAVEAKRDTAILHLPHNILFAFGSAAIHAQGTNLMAGLLDEANFVGGNAKTSSQASLGQAKALFDNTWRRMKSRFRRSPSPGLLFLISQKRSKSDFLEELVRDWSGDPAFINYKVKIWEAKPGDFPSGKFFRVQVGNQQVPTKELIGDEEPEPGFVATEMPVELHSEFKQDPEGCLRDYAGIAVGDEFPLIGHREKIYACINQTRSHPFDQNELIISLDDSDTIEDHFLAYKVAVQKIGHVSPRIHPQAPRFIHLDLGLTNDAYGISMVHFTGEDAIKVQVEGTSDNLFLKEPRYLTVPRIYVDFTLRIRSAPGSEVDLDKPLQFIVFLRDRCGFRIKRVTSDSWQSRSSIQLLHKAGFEVKANFSVDRSDIPYLTLSRIIMAEQIDYYDYEWEDARGSHGLQWELVHLQRDLQKRKVDHPLKVLGQPGEKDIADSLCGAVWSALEADEAYRLPDVLPITSGQVEQIFKPNHDGSFHDWVVGRYDNKVKTGQSVRMPVKDLFGRAPRKD